MSGEHDEAAVELEDPLVVEALAKARREADDWMSDPAWERVSEGSASAADIERLRSLAPDSASFEAYLAASQPLDAGPIADAVVREAGVADAADNVVAIDRGGKSGRRQAWGLALTGLVIAAVAGFLLVTQVGGGESLPAYDWQVSGGLSETRSDPTPEDPLVAKIGQTLTVVAKPASAVGTVLGARAYWSRGESVIPLSTRNEFAPSGALRATVILDAPGLTPGTGELTLVLGPRQELDRVGAGEPPPTIARRVWPLTLER